MLGKLFESGVVGQLLLDLLEHFALDELSRALALVGVAELVVGTVLLRLARVFAAAVRFTADVVLLLERSGSHVAQSEQVLFDLVDLLLPAL